MDLDELVWGFQRTTGSKRPSPSLPIIDDREVKIPRRPAYEHGINSDDQNDDLLPGDYLDTPMDYPLDEGPAYFNPISESSYASQVPTMPLLDEHVEAVNDYDTCFGVIQAFLNLDLATNLEASSIPVTLTSIRGAFMLSDQTSTTHCGMLSDRELVRALCQYPLKLDATLFVSEHGGVKEQRTQQQGPELTEQMRLHNLRIVVYGMHKDKDVLGSLLGDAGHFLQHPSAAEVVPDIRYDNPHCLVRPGEGMPKLEQQQLDNAHQEDAAAEVADETSKDRLMRIFDSADASGFSGFVQNTLPSPRLRSSLMRHQIVALAMMLEKENGFVEQPIFPSLWKREPSKDRTMFQCRNTITRFIESRPIAANGGIIADDMGLGKTLSILALICSTLDFKSTLADQAHTRHQNTGNRGTLIIAPKSTMHNWKTQIPEHIHKEQIRWMVYYGNNRKNMVAQFPDTDIVITTYETLREDRKLPQGTPSLFSWEWLRIVLDEAHHIRNRSKQTFRSVCNLVSQFRWCLTGTPIHNCLDDYGALLNFIRAYPFTQKSIFFSWIVKPIEENHPMALERLQKLISATCLRRTKDAVFTSGEFQLPPRTERTQSVYLHPEDQELYNAIKKVCQNSAAGLDKLSGRNRKSQNILLLINAMRLVCNHGYDLLPKSLKVRRNKNSVDVSVSETKQIHYERCRACDGDLDGEWLGTEVSAFICINCANSEEDAQSTFEQNVFPQTITSSRYRPSAKVLALMDNLKREQSASRPDYQPRKSVIFSFWVKMLDLVEKALHEEPISYQRIDGSTTLEGRQKAMDEFKDNPDCTVLLASIGSSAEGVNLTAAGVVHLLEPHWNPMVEAQAVDRVYRIGQDREVEVIRYIVPDSVEILVQKKQQEKLQIVNEAINTTSVTEADLEDGGWKAIQEILPI